MGGNRGRAGREQTTTAILDAAEELFAQRGFTAVTVRDIAAAAGVSHALVHRYLGPKERIYAAVLGRHEVVVRDAAGQEDDLLAASSLMAHAAILHESRYLRLIVHSALHGLPYDDVSARFVATERLIELAEAAAAKDPAADPGAPSPRLVIASLVAMLLGWLATRDWLLPAAGIGDLSDEELAAAIERIVVDVEHLYFPGAGPERTR